MHQRTNDFQKLYRKEDSEMNSKIWVEIDPYFQLMDAKKGNFLNI
jgi:hypothetical protein